MRDVAVLEPVGEPVVCGVPTAKEQVAPIARKAPTSPEIDEHDADLAPTMTVSQIPRALRSAAGATSSPPADSPDHPRDHLSPPPSTPTPPAKR
jgi:hypothetical protein